jgi:WD40 repeat protein
VSEVDSLARGVTKRLADARLLVTGAEVSTETLSVELAHEALIRGWERLRGWLNEDREFLLWRQRLKVQVDDWWKHSQEASYLLRGMPLSEAERWLLGRPQELTEAEQQFIRYGVAIREREREEKKQRQETEIKRLRRSAVLLGTLLLVALVTVLYAFWQRTSARARELISASIANREADPELAVRLAAESVAVTWVWGHSVLPEAENELHHALLASHVRATLVGHTDSVLDVGWSLDGHRIVTSSNDQTIRTWDAASGQQLTSPKHPNYFSRPTLSPEAKRLAAEGYDNTVTVWDVQTGREIVILRGHLESVAEVAWSPDGKELATASDDGTAKVWDAGTGTELLTLAIEARRRRLAVRSIAWSPDGKRLATAGGNGTHVWDAHAGRELQSIGGYSSSIAWSPDGQQLLIASDDGTAKVCSANTGTEVLTLRGHTAPILSVAWSPDGQKLATGSKDHTAKVWEAQIGKELLTLNGHRDAVSCVKWSPDGQLLATGSWDRTVRIWEARSNWESLLLNETVYCVAWSPDGKHLAGSGNSRVIIWDAVTGAEALMPISQVGTLESLAWSPDGRRIAIASLNGTAKVWDVKTGGNCLLYSIRRGLSSASRGAQMAVSSQWGTWKV